MPRHSVNAFAAARDTDAGSAEEWKSAPYPSSLSMEKSQRRSRDDFDIPYDVTLRALRAFHTKHSHLVLPRRYVVPATDEYPEALHGIDLALAVYNMKWWMNNVRDRPDRVNELHELGFVWDRLQPEWNLILESLIAYRAQFGHVNVPASFVVPTADVDENDSKNQWPIACRGIALGRAVHRIRNRGDHLRGYYGNNKKRGTDDDDDDDEDDYHEVWLSRRNQLNALGFVWDVGEQKFVKFCDALVLYRQIEMEGSNRRGRGPPLSSMSSMSGVSSSHQASPLHSALRIPRQFIIPRSSYWPNEFWGYNLGERCAQVQSKRVYIKGHPDRRRILVDLGLFVDDDDDGKNTIKEGREVGTGGTGGNGSDKIDPTEVVPEAAAAPSLQIDGNSWRDQKFAKFCDALRLYRHIEAEDSNEGGGGGEPSSSSSSPLPYSLQVPHEFVIPQNSRWPNEFWGYPLGRRCYSVRYKRIYVKGRPDRRRVLADLGFFVYGDDENENKMNAHERRFAKFCDALRLYEHNEMGDSNWMTRGELEIPSRFVIPRSSRWPNELWGYRLGERCFGVRSSNRRYVKGRPDRVRVLADLGFFVDNKDENEHKTLDQIFAKFCDALRLYRQIEMGESGGSSSPQPPPLDSSLKIPREFVIPQSSRWPNEFWGYKLGERSYHVRSQRCIYVKGRPDRRRVLADLGFFVDDENYSEKETNGGIRRKFGNNKVRWLEVVHAAALYSQMNGNSLDVPSTYTVPAPPRRVLPPTLWNDGEEKCDEDAAAGLMRRSTSVVGSDEAWPWPGTGGTACLSDFDKMQQPIWVVRHRPPPELILT
jgi:hypothetical protein